MIYTKKAPVEKGSVLQGKLMVNQDSEVEGEFYKESDDKREFVMERRFHGAKGNHFLVGVCGVSSGKSGWCARGVESCRGKE